MPREIPKKISSKIEDIKQAVVKAGTVRTTLTSIDNTTNELLALSSELQYIFFGTDSNSTLKPTQESESFQLTLESLNYKVNELKARLEEIISAVRE
jgi:hypothetical protein